MRTSVKNCRRGQIRRAIRSPSALLHCLSAFYSWGQVSPLSIKDAKGMGCCLTAPACPITSLRVSSPQPLRAERASYFTELTWVLSLFFFFFKSLNFSTQVWSHSLWWGWGSLNFSTGFLYNEDLQLEGLSFVISCSPWAKPISHADISHFC